MTTAGTLTLAEAAERLGIHRSTARRWAKEGRELAPGVRAFRVCAYWKVAQEPLEQLLGAPPVALVASATAALHPPMRGEAEATNGAGGGRAADNCITSGVVAEPPLKTTPPTGPLEAT